MVLKICNFQLQIDDLMTLSFFLTIFKPKSLLKDICSNKENNRSSILETIMSKQNCMCSLLFIQKLV